MQNTWWSWIPYFSWFHTAFWVVHLLTLPKTFNCSIIHPQMPQRWQRIGRDMFTGFEHSIVVKQLTFSHKGRNHLKHVDRVTGEFLLPMMLQAVRHGAAETQRHRGGATGSFFICLHIQALRLSQDKLHFTRTCSPDLWATNPSSPQWFHLISASKLACN